MKALWKKAAGMGGGLIAFFITTSSALAFGNAPNSIQLCDPLGNNCNYGGESFTSIANNVAQFLVVDVAVPVVVIMVLVGAFQIMTAGGDPEKFSTGRKTIMYAAIGFAAALIALGAVDIIKSFLGQ